MSLLAKNKVELDYMESKMKVDGKESDTKMYIVLGEGLKTYNGFQWKPGRWNEEPNDVGAYVWKNRPNYAFIPYMPNHTYLVEEVEQLLGEDAEKAQYKRVKISEQPLSLDDLLGEDKKGFFQAYLHKANFSEINLGLIDFSKAYLREANFYKANLSQAYFSEAYLSQACLRGANLYKAFLSLADLSRADLSIADLHKAYLYETNLSKADLHVADLHNANLSQANLFKANLSKANLSEADLFRANLSEANLYKADLFEANLYKADLSRADLSEANLYKAYFLGAHGVKNNPNLSIKQRSEAHC